MESLLPRENVQAEANVKSQVELSDSIYLSNFAIIIAISSTLPELQLKATLTVKLQDSDPFVVHGVLVGTVYGARGEL